MSIVVTGGAGFIGSCMVRTLNDAGYSDIVIVDHFASTEKWKNLRNKEFTEYIHKDQFLDRLPGLRDVTAVFHFGACSSTTELDFDYLYHNNVHFSKVLWNWCAEREIPFLYASSAATYGDGVQGYSDVADIKGLFPLNGYGFSKQLFDLWAQKQTKAPPQHVGFKFFNVYGPNEYHKGSMSSVVLHAYHKLKSGESVPLFKSYHKDYPDGGQLRDFVYVKDVCSVILYFFTHPELSGLFNVGTGRAQSFCELASAVCSVLEVPTKIEYIEMPENLRTRYQYFTRADIVKLRRAGYDAPFVDLSQGVRDYVLNYLERGVSVY